jgi:hypothetical protein
MKIICTFCFLALLHIGKAQYILTDAKAPAVEKYAAQELVRYIYQLTGKVLLIKTSYTGVPAFVIGKSNSSVVDLFLQKVNKKKDTTGLGSEGYQLKTIQYKNNSTILITADEPVGCMYGVYGLLEDYYGVGFYLGHDAIPPKKEFYLPQVNEVKKPSMKIRGFLPWTNFPQSATVYSWQDWKFIINQAAKMRMNFIQIHNYNGEAGHNEMFHNFTVNGHTSRVWMPTAKTGHGWSCPGFDIAKYRFGGEDLFDDYDFGSDCALHNETLSNEQVFAKGVSLFKRVIDYAHTRGVKIALGLDIDLILPEYKTTADDPKVIEARMQQVLKDYRELDYLVLFISELINNKPDKLAVWKKTFDGMYNYMLNNYFASRIVVAGWGLSKEIAATLPLGVVAAPISHYSDGFEDGSIYGNREYWGCPWMERDFFSSEYYYPYDMHLSNTIKAWQGRNKNMKGFYTLTWRLTDAIDPKITFIAKAPWDDKGKYKTSYDVYYDYAAKNYGVNAAKAITDIINENEPFSCNDAECQPTGAFTGKLLEESNYLLNIHKVTFKQQAITLFAHRYDSICNAGIEKRDDADSCVAFVKDNAFIKFKQINFGPGVDSFTSYAATTYPFAAIDIRLDSLQGKSIKAIAVPTTGGWHNWKPFTTVIEKITGVHDVYFVFKGTKRQQEEISKANKQLQTIAHYISTEKNKDNIRRMKYVQARLAAAQQHLQLGSNFPLIGKASALPGIFPAWVKNFTHRVTDISSLGNVQSIENRYVQERYLAKENELQQKAVIKFPTSIAARGTTTGAVITWTNNEPGCKGFYVYADEKKINGTVIPATDSSFIHTADAFVKYQVTAVNEAGTESEWSPSATCLAGRADAEAPHIVLVSPPSSVKQGANFSVTVRLLDNGQYNLLTATLYYRSIGAAQWKKILMQRRVKAIFTADIPCSQPVIMEYYIAATDGSNTAVFPAAAPTACNSFVVEHEGSKKQIAVPLLSVHQQKLQWKNTGGQNDITYKIYRSALPACAPVAANYLTYLPAAMQEFTDNGVDFNNKPLQGKWYYRIAVVLQNGIEIPGRNVVVIGY